MPVSRERIVNDIAPYLAESVVTCPSCAHAEIAQMPVDACIFSYTCTGCGAELRASDGRCVYCAHGSVPCPPVQIAAARGEEAHCCRGPD